MYTLLDLGASPVGISDTHLDARYTFFMEQVWYLLVQYLLRRLGQDDMEAVVGECRIGRCSTMVLLDQRE